MNPEIKIISEKKLVGNRLVMSLANNRTSKLWKNFMPRRKEISNSVSGDLISMQIYNPTYFSDFNPENEFEKWAAVEVSDYSNIPQGMETFTLAGGLYAVFVYKGLSTDRGIFDYIFGTWIPDSDYLPDDRPHFEVLGDRYKNDDPDSEEEIWIPVRGKVTLLSEGEEAW